MMASYDWRVRHVGLMAIAAIGEAVLLRRGDENRKSVVEGKPEPKLAELTLTNFVSSPDVSLFRSC